MTRRCPRCATQWPDDLGNCPHDGELLPAPTADEDDDKSELDLLETYGCAPGDELGQYRLLRLIGLGGMAAVFEGEHNVISQPVAVKVLHRELHDSADDVRRFFHEARAITELKHPGIVECLDFADGTADTPPYLVMELVGGQTLDAVIQERAPLPLDEAVSIVSQICDAMAVVHEQGILHRDLKPANIMVLEPKPDDEGPRIKLLDFGVAKYLVTEEHFLRTATGAVLGTPEYMAPEVVRGQKLTPTTDVYALGGVLYQLLTGRLPYVCDTLGQLIQAQLRTPAESPSSVSPAPHASHITSSLDKLVLGCLSKSPELRVPSMSDLQARLKRVLAGEDTGVVEMPADLPPLPAKPSRLAWLGLGLGVMALAATVLWWLWGGGTKPQRREPAQPTRPAVTRVIPDASAPLKPRARPRPGARRTELVSKPPGAAVFRADNGQFLGKTPLGVMVPAAGLRVVLRLRGHEDTQIDVPRQGESPLVATLVPRTDPVMRPMGIAPPPRAMRPMRPAMSAMDPNVKWGTVDPFRKKP